MLGDMMENMLDSVKEIWSDSSFLVLYSTLVLNDEMHSTELLCAQSAQK